MSYISGKIIDCSTLAAGEFFKDYKSLCGRLGEEVKSGNQKIYQLRNWERFFGVEREGRGYRITEVYGVPCAARPERKPKGGRWLGFIEPLLLGELAANGGYISTTNTELIVLLGLVKPEFLKLNGYGGKKCGLFEITDDGLYKWSVRGGDGAVVENRVTSSQLSYFKSAVGMKAYSVVGAGISALSARGVIKTADEYKIGVSVKGGIELRDADDREIDAIIELERAAAKEVGCSTLGKVIGRGLYDEYRHVFNNMAVVEHGWSKTFHNRVIVVGGSVKSSGVTNKKELSRLRTGLNRQFTVALLDKARDDKTRFGRQSGFSGGQSKNTVISMAVGSRDFIGSQKRLSDYLIRI